MYIYENKTPMLTVLSKMQKQSVKYVHIYIDVYTDSHRITQNTNL